MLVAVGTDVQVRVEVLFPDDLAAFFAFNSKTFGANFLLARCIQRSRFPLKP